MTQKKVEQSRILCEENQFKISQIFSLSVAISPFFVLLNKISSPVDCEQRMKKKEDKLETSERKTHFDFEKTKNIFYFIFLMSLGTLKAIELCRDFISYKLSLL